VLTVLTHGFGLILIREKVELRLLRLFSAPVIAFAVVVAATVLLLTILHAIEAGAWAAAYIALGARPDVATAMLYSLGAMTTYGHANVYVAEHWQLMGALEALNGMILFGLTTAYLFSVLQTNWPADAKPPRSGSRSL
jgi:hypothetical protein